MKFLAKTFPTPQENLAADEALLELAEADSIETLRVWESPTPFVVLGFSSKLTMDVDVAACARENIPILRRVSGGGTVIQAPGCLSYALTLCFNAADPLGSATGANAYIMATQRAALQQLLGEPVTIHGHTDLATAGRKFSGNAQKRGRRALLFHGAILHRADLHLLARLLHHPARQPDWRQHRSHHDFLTQPATSPATITATLRHAWQAHDPLDPAILLTNVARLATRHHQPHWIHKHP